MWENRLEELRDIKNLKAKEVANYFNVAESTYSEWEHNKIPIPTKRIVQLANFYEVNIDFMLNLSSKKKHIVNANELNLELIGQHLKEIRDELGLSLRELGDKLNSAFSSLGSYERGEHLIQSENLINICKISNCSIDWVLGLSEDKYLK
jgi:transcriptional regulator with XRE-family HTH domain